MKIQFIHQHQFLCWQRPFGLARNAKSADFPEGNCKIAWDRLISKYTSYTTQSLLKLNGEFCKSKLESIEHYPDEWISNLDGLRICIGEFGQKGSITYKDFIIHVLNNLPEEYDLILDVLKNCLMESGHNALTNEVIRASTKCFEQICSQSKLISSLLLFFFPLL